jgi:hypothetical protein
VIVTLLSAALNFAFGEGAEGFSHAVLASSSESLRKLNSRA